MSMNNKIKDAVIAVTYRCNSKCGMCGIWQKKNYFEADSGIYLNLPKGLTDINITGGEPFLHNGLVKIFENIVKKAPAADIVISTNGFATELIIKKMECIHKIKKNIAVAVSIDGIGGRHNKIRGVENGYNKALSTINKLKSMGIKKLKLAFTLGDYNYDELKNVYELARFLDLEFSFSLVHSSENYFAKQNKIMKKIDLTRTVNWLIEKELAASNYKNWGRAYFAHGVCEFLKTGKRLLPDYSGILNIFIDPAGNIYPNSISDYKIGHLSNFQNGLKFAAAPENWMVCTARQAILKHWAKAGYWILKNK